MWNLGVKANARSTQCMGFPASSQLSGVKNRSSPTNISGPFAKKLEANKISKD